MLTINVIIKHWNIVRNVGKTKGTHTCFVKVIWDVFLTQEFITRICLSSDKDTILEQASEPCYAQGNGI